MGGFDVNLLRYKDDASTADLKTLIDICSTDANVEILSGNIVTHISDHLAEFLGFPLKQTPHKSWKEIYKRNYKNVNVGQFMSQLWNTYWQEALKINKKETNVLFITPCLCALAAIQFCIGN